VVASSLVPDTHAEEGELAQRLIIEFSDESIRSLLEIGSGEAIMPTLKNHFEMILMDLFPEMLSTSRQLNPDCEHASGGMRSVMEITYIHCRPGGVVLFMLDHVKETFEPSTKHGSTDDTDRGLRYLEWPHDLDETDTTSW